MKLIADEAPESELTRVSLDADVAEGLEIGLGDRITWDIQGVQLPGRTRHEINAEVIPEGDVDQGQKIEHPVIRTENGRGQRGDLDHVRGAGTIVRISGTEPWAD